MAKKETEAEIVIGIEELTKEAQRLGLKIPRISIAGFKSKKSEDIEKEEARVKKQLRVLLETAIAKYKANARMKPIEKRRRLLAGRFKAVKARARAHTYSDANIKAWLEEFNMINNTPKQWIAITANGTKPFTPGNKRKRSARDILDGMNLEDEGEGENTKE